MNIEIHGWRKTTLVGLYSDGAKTDSKQTTGSLVSVSDIVISMETLEPEKKLRISERSASRQGGGIKARLTPSSLNNRNCGQHKVYCGFQATAYFLRSSQCRTKGRKGTQAESTMLSALRKGCCLLSRETTAGCILRKVYLPESTELFTENFRRFSGSTLSL